MNQLTVILIDAMEAIITSFISSIITPLFRTIAALFCLEI